MTLAVSHMDAVEREERYCQLLRSKEAYCRVNKMKERREQLGTEDVQE